MDLLHVILAFNLVTSIGILVGSYAMYRDDRPAPTGTLRPKLNLAGMSGAAVGLGLMTGIVALFV
jgi:hypothetical protein